jgi:hypothetical protein
MKYQPPDWKAPKTRVAAATRGPGMGSLHLTLLVPEQTGYTSEASPTLYWYVSERFRGPVVVTLLGQQEADPLLELRLDRGVEAGVQAVPLETYKVALEPGGNYEWSVTLIVDPTRPSADAFASGTIARAPGARLPQTGDDVDKLAALAAQGYWYDALDLSSRQIAAHPRVSVWRETRAALLDQVGLDEPAAWDRRALAASASQ